MNTPRPATLRDVPQMADILQDWIESTPWMPKLHTRSETRKFLLDRFESTELTVVGSFKAEGFMCLDGEEISALYVAQGFRGRGIGSVLVESAQAARPGLFLWSFQQNVAARNFYARHGFHETELSDGSRNDEQLPDVRLAWNQK